MAQSYDILKKVQQILVAQIQADEDRRVLEALDLMKTCPMCRVIYEPGHHPDNGCDLGRVEVIMEA